MSDSIVMNIQKFSIHDGPGIRTTVFFKGCPLSCWWCHNPESLKCDFEILYFEDKCVHCGACAAVCPTGAIEMVDGKMTRDAEKCNLCNNCTDACLQDALQFVGEEMSVWDVMDEIERDLIFYEESDGGVTFSGGEPFIHTDFLEKILPMCKDKDIHTTIDTSLYTSWENIERTLEYTDLYMVDLKLMDNDKHKKYIGVDNSLILENLKKLSNSGANIFIRMPIIKGVNDDEEHIDAAIEFINGLNILQVNLLPYHKMGMEKYERLGMEYKLTGEEEPSEKKLKLFSNKFKLNGIKVKIGG